MKKLKNDGFILIETIVVAVIVLSIFIMIYENLVPAIEESKIRLRYDDLDTVYAVNTFKNLIISDGNYDIIKEQAKVNGYVNITDCNVFSNTKTKNMCQTLKTEFGIVDNNRIYLIFSSFDSVLGISNLPRGLYDYISYLQDNEGEYSRAGYTLLLSRTVTFINRYDENVTKDINYYANITM